MSVGLKGLGRVFLTFLVIFGGTPGLMAQRGNWGDGRVDLTIAEFLELAFNVALHTPESDAFNSFNLISFYPSSSPSKAIIVIIQAYNANGHSTDEPEMRRQIRQVADALVAGFASHCGLPLIQKRWLNPNPKSALVIKHVRANDLRDVLAVTIEGDTSFDSPDFARGEKLVKARGGAWSW